MMRATSDGTSGADVGAGRQPCAQVARGDRCRLDLEEQHALGPLELREHARRAARAGSPAASRPRAAFARAPRPGSRQDGKSQNWSAPIRNTGSTHSGWARSVSTVRGVLVENDLVVGKRRARQAQARLGRRRDRLVPGCGDDEHEQTVDARAPASRAGRARRGRGAAGRTRRRRGRALAEARPRRRSRRARRPARPAARSARSSSSGGGGVPTSRNPRSVRKSRHGRAFGSGR